MKLIDSEIDHYWVHFQAGGAEKSKVYPRALVKCYNHDDFAGWSFKNRSLGHVPESFAHYPDHGSSEHAGHTPESEHPDQS